MDRYEINVNGTKFVLYVDKEEEKYEVYTTYLKKEKSRKKNSEDSFVEQEAILIKTKKHENLQPREDAIKYIASYLLSSYEDMEGLLKDLP